jgi:DNA helicase MCM8
MFGGNQKEVAKGKVAILGDIHCLVVGDPGLGKSQLLRAVTKVAPRGVYVCGNTTSTSGSVFSFVMVCFL